MSILFEIIGATLKYIILSLFLSQATQNACAATRKYLPQRSIPIHSSNSSENSLRAESRVPEKAGTSLWSNWSGEGNTNSSIHKLAHLEQAAPDSTLQHPDGKLVASYEPLERRDALDIFDLNEVTVPDINVAHNSVQKRGNDEILSLFDDEDDDFDFFPLPQDRCSIPVASSYKIVPQPGHHNFGNSHEADDNFQVCLRFDQCSLIGRYHILTNYLC